MVVILIGYPGSKKIRKASEYLVNKYLRGFEIHWLECDVEIDKWSMFLAAHLEKLQDKQIILGLDDYLIASAILPLDVELGEAVCVKLCFCSDKENEEYPVTTQYTLWNRQYLVNLLSQTTTPWNFEIQGSKIFKQNNQIMMHRPVLHYDPHSALSSRWEGVNLAGLSEEDVKEVQKLI